MHLNRFLTTTTVLMMATGPAVGADLLPLSHGIFIESSVGCSNASNATALSFWGDELNSARVIGTIMDVSQKGNVYEVRLDMNSQGQPAGKEDWQIVIDDPNSMTVTSPYGTQHYNWCFNEMPF